MQVLTVTVEVPVDEVASGFAADNPETFPIAGWGLQVQEALRERVGFTEELQQRFRWQAKSYDGLITSIGEWLIGTGVLDD